MSSWRYWCLSAESIGCSAGELLDEGSQVLGRNLV